MPLTLEEQERHEAYKARKNAQFKKWRAKKKAEAPPKPPRERKPTKKERYKDIATRKKAGFEITAEEQALYDAYRQERRDCHKKWRDAQAKGNPESLAIADIKKRMRDNLPLTDEQAAFHAEWLKEKNAGRRRYYHDRKVGAAAAVGQ